MSKKKTKGMRKVRKLKAKKTKIEQRHNDCDLKRNGGSENKAAVKINFKKKRPNNSEQVQQKGKQIKASSTRDVSAAIEYLKSWSSRQSDDSLPWKFNKNLQSTLIKHMYDASQITDGPCFEQLLCYLEGLKGGLKERVTTEAQEIVDAGADQGLEKPAKDNEENKEEKHSEEETIELSARKRQRAMQVLRTLA
mmetsp:Transcript_18768/g.24779  ORF Transcript_18768/g.24779 Transcript_18768/m.24779 type:complete len:194 (-) Transcript_18768:188-769(-)